jgi:hypothetical protein
MLAVSCCVPLAAQAGSLLSGYGGPGQGQQQILGSTLLGGGGGSSGGSAGGGATGGERGAGERGLAGPVLASSSKASGAGATGRAGRRVQPRPSTQRGRSPVQAAPADVPTYPASERVASSGAGSGLSFADILFIFLGAAALAFTGILTTRLSHANTARGGH